MNIVNTKNVDGERLGLGKSLFKAVNQSLKKDIAYEALVPEYSKDIKIRGKSSEMLLDFTIIVA